jgi:tRNA U34 5-methylaminomethyl-2-thiouridine-forming methyltransferase MnmC
MLPLHDEFQIISTADGSSTVKTAMFKETYHSIHGAVQESNHVFIEQGLKFWISEHGSTSVNILELGFGTGLNPLLTKQYLKGKEFSVYFHSIEKYPLGINNAKNIKFPFANPSEEEWFFDLHAFDRPIAIQEEKLNFQFFPHSVDFFEFYSDTKFDILYFDVFAPSCQPIFWEIDFLSSLQKMMKEGSLLVTYGAKGSFKRALKELGFTVYNPPGPKGKREMTRAIFEKL